MGQYDPKTPKGLNTVSFSLIAGALVLGYLGWFYLPHWFDVFRLTGIMKHTAYEAYREPENKKLVDNMLKRAKERGVDLTVDNFEITREMYSPEELINMRGEQMNAIKRRGKAVTIKLHYEVDAKWPLTSKIRRLKFNETRHQNIETVTW